MGLMRFHIRIHRHLLSQLSQQRPLEVCLPRLQDLMESIRNQCIPNTSINKLQPSSCRA